MRSNLVGNKYSRLTVIAYKETKKGKAYWNCICDCGNNTCISTSDLVTGNTMSCGCLNKEITSKLMTTHGLSKTSEYFIWLSMKDRCLNPKNKNYFNYGGRGIIISEKWINSFETFLKDMGNKPKKHSLERVNNNEGYNKDNCKWVTMLKQANNKRNNVKILNTDTNEVFTSIAEAARSINMEQSTLHNHLTGKIKNKTKFIKI
jgi:hypothetical protein